MVDVITIPIGFSNCYLLHERGNHILVDTASPGSERKLLRKLRALGLAPEAISLIILTHCHADHTGCAEYLREKHGLKIAMHRSDAGNARPVGYRSLQGRLLEIASRAAIGAQQLIEPDCPLEGGLGLHSYGISAEIICLPGHTKGSVGVLLDDSRLICGDAIMNFTQPQLCHIAEDFIAAADTLAKIGQLGLSTIYPGHGKHFSPGDIKSL